MTKPWMTALEMQFAALRRNAAYLREHPELGWLHNVNTHLRHADCFAFTAETAAAIACAARSVPMASQVNREMFPCHAGWWWFEQPITIHGLDADTDECMAVSWELADQIYLFAWVMDVADDGHIDPIPIFHERAAGISSLVELAAAMSKDDPRHADNIRASVDLWRFLMAGTTWLRQRIASTTIGHIERHRRKQLAREYQADVSDVKVIELRRRETLSPPSSAQGEPVDWSCRWIVNGHWRNQPYKDRHELIYILPYVKGPDDKPLRVPTHTVYAVDR